MSNPDGQTPDLHAPARLDGPIWLRLVFMLIVAGLMSIAQSLVFLLALIQVVILLVDNRQPNPRIAEAGEILGRWIAQAAHYLTFAQAERPWPFAERP